MKLYTTPHLNNILPMLVVPELFMQNRWLLAVSQFTAVSRATGLGNLVNLFK